MNGVCQRFGAIFCLTTLFCSLAMNAPAKDRLAGPVLAEVVRVIDGDTILVRAKIWLGQEVETKVRLNAIDTPELKGKCPQERLLAIKARDFVYATIQGGPIVLRDIQYGKYAGRVVSTIETQDGQNLAALLIARGLGYDYHGGKRRKWCPA